MNDWTRIARQIARECPALRAREVARMLSRIYDAALRPLAIQSSQLSVLVAVTLFGEGGARIGPLADRLVLDRTTLTRNVQPLEKAGLLRVARSPDDARARVVTITRTGQRLLEAAYPLWQEAQRRARRQFGGARMDALRTHSEQLMHSAAHLDDDGKPRS